MAVVGVAAGSVAVGRGVVVEMTCVAAGFKVAAGRGVRVGRRVGALVRVGVGSVPQVASKSSKRTRMELAKMRELSGLPRGIDYSVRVERVGEIITQALVPAL